MIGEGGEGEELPWITQEAVVGSRGVAAMGKKGRDCNGEQGRSRDGEEREQFGGAGAAVGDQEGRIVGVVRPEPAGSKTTPEAVRPGEKG